MKTPLGLIALTCVMLTLDARSDAANNLVVNGGFESGFAGWQGTYGVLDASGYAFEGSHVGVIIDVGSSSVDEPIYQTIATTPGSFYFFNFSLLSGYGRIGEYPDPGNAPVNVFFGDQYLGVFSNPSTSAWQSYQFELQADSTSTTISFVDHSDMHWQLLDGVSVVATPEPGSLALLGLGFVALAGRLYSRTVNNDRV